MKISFKRIDIYLKRWIDKINGQNINDKDDKTQLETYYDIWQSALSNMENAAFKDDIVLVLYENLLFELIAIKRLKKTDLKEFTNKDELIEYIDEMVKDKNKECFKDAYEEIKLYERCLEKCSRYSCLLPKVNNCIHAVNSGVGRVHILDGRREHCLLLEFFTKRGIGTAIIGDDSELYSNEK